LKNYWNVPGLGKIIVLPMSWLKLPKCLNSALHYSCVATVGAPWWFWRDGGASTNLSYRSWSRTHWKEIEDEKTLVWPYNFFSFFKLIPTVLATRTRSGVVQSLLDVWARLDWVVQIWLIWSNGLDPNGFKLICWLEIWRGWIY
jgi:hypothetical protein